jgi:hypothetical protein
LGPLLEHPPASGLAPAVRAPGARGNMVTRGCSAVQWARSQLLSNTSAGYLWLGQCSAPVPPVRWWLWCTMVVVRPDACSQSGGREGSCSVLQCIASYSAQCSAVRSALRSAVQCSAPQLHCATALHYNATTLHTTATARHHHCY